MLSGESPTKKQKVAEHLPMTASNKFVKPPRAKFPVMSEDELKPLMVPYSNDEKFGTNLRKTLSEFGAAVVTGVLSAEEIAAFEELKKSELQQQSAQPGGMQHAQGELAWKARLQPRLRSSFEKAFDAPVLSVSSDILTIFYTPEGTPAASDNHQWLHVDQPVVGGNACFQGILYIHPSTAETSSTTALWPKSHLKSLYRKDLLQDPADVKKWDEELAVHNIPTDSGVLYGHVMHTKLENWPPEEKIWHAALEGVKRVPVPAGSLLLFDSRTVHQGWNSGHRFAVPVCWEPRERVGRDATARKLCLAAGGFATSHSPSEGRVHPLIARDKGDAARARRPVCRPFSVKPEAEQEWDKLWESWTGETFVEDAIATADAASFARVLRPEIASALGFPGEW